MKKNIYLSILAVAVVGSVGLVSTDLLNNETAYHPRVEGTDESESIDGAGEYWNSLRANQFTGVVDPLDVDQAKTEVLNFEKSRGKATFPFSWKFAGPDNRGGRTRAMIVDRNDNNILYAGGVMGGVFKSTNKGASWYPIDDQMIDMSIGSMCQTVDGTIYVGTGEGNAGAQETATPQFSGGGIYKSTDDGKTFEKITTTSGFRITYRLVAHPTKNIVFAATNSGLRASDEGDDTKWNLVLGGNVEDFVLDKNGNALAYANVIYRSTDPTTNGSFKQVAGIPLVTGNRRMAIAFSNSDPNYVYVIAVGSASIDGPIGFVTTNSGLNGVFQSKDNGQNFEQIIGSASSFFAPFTSLTSQIAPGVVRSQGYWDLCIGVHPTEKERIFIGGVDFAEWTPETGARIVGNLFDSKANPMGIHADKHQIVFDTVSKPAIMYITSDGGVARTTNAGMTNYTPLYTGYATTQFYGIGAGTNGIIIGGTQDNNTMVIDGKGNTPQSAFDMIGGDGFQCEVSEINPDVVFGESQYLGLRRSLGAGSNSSPIWDDRIKNSGELISVRASDNVVLQANSIFNTPIELYENLEDSTNRLFVALDNSIWMADGASLSPSPQWYKVADVPGASNAMHVTHDGNVLIVGGSGWVTRIAGLNKTVWDTAMIPATVVPDSLTITDIKGNIPGSRQTTDIEIDKNNPNRVIVTLGNYGNSTYVYLTENALDETPTWKSIQGSMPAIPVYDAEISYTDPDVIVLGTEYGVYYTQNGTASSPTWMFNQDSLPRVPILQMQQVEEKVWKNGKRTGAVMYVGTHGRGIWKSSSLLTSAKTVSKEVRSINLYPNPAQNQVSFEMPVLGKDEVLITVLNYQGQVVKTSSMDISGTTVRISLDVSDIPAGNYIVSVKGNLHKSAAKLVKLD